MNQKIAQKPEEEIILLLAGLFGAAAAIRWISRSWSTTVGPWATDHGVLIDRRANPLIEIPGLGGAGLDTPRIALAVAALMVIGLLVAAWGRHLARAFLARRDAPAPRA